MENYDLMDEMKKMLVESLRKSGLAVTLLCVGFTGMWGLYTGDKKQMKEDYQLLKLETGLELRSLRSELATCNAANMAFAVKLAAAEVEIRSLNAAMKRHK